MNHLLAILEQTGSDADYLRIIYELLIEDELIGTMKNVSTDEATLSKVRLLERVITQWEDVAMISESETE